MPKKQPASFRKSSPPAPVDQEQADAFAAGAPYADPPEPEEAAAPEYPWEAPGLRDDVDKGYFVPIAEPDYHKLKYIASRTAYSMRRFCREVLKEAINQEIKRLTRS